MLSNSSKYALKAILYIAANATEEKKITAKEIGDPINVPTSYVAKLLQELARQNIVSSVKGRHGGFYLNSENMETSLLKIVEAIDGEDKLRSCILSLKECDVLNPCPIHHLVGKIKDDFTEQLARTTIKDLVTEMENGNSVLPL